MTLLDRLLAQLLWCACQYTLDGMHRDDPRFLLICDAQYELGGMF